MVSLDLKKTIRKKLGKGLAKSFQNHCQDVGLKNKKGNPYSESHIRHYIYTQWGADEIDLEFLRFANAELEKIKAIKKQEIAMLEDFKAIA